MDPVLVGILSILAILVLIMLGIPVAYTLGALGILGLALIMGPKAAVGQLVSAAYGMTAQYTWAVAPMFIVIGSLAGMAGITTEAFDAAKKWLGRLPGGLAMATTAASGAFAACSGSTVANSAIFTPLALPEMLRHGYDKRLSIGCIAATGTFAAMIPPSLVMVIYCMITNEPLGQMLVAGIFPGILTVVIYLLSIYIRAVRNPQLAPMAQSATTWMEKFTSLKGSWGILLVFLTIMVGIYTGWFAPSAAGAVGAAVTFLIIIARRKMHWPRLLNIAMDTTLITSTIFLIIIGGTIFSRFWLVSGVITKLSGFITGLDVPPILIIIIFLILLAVLGCFMDPPSIMVITLPLVHPIVTGLGYSGIWFGILMMKTVEIGVLTPPVGINCFVVQAASGGEVKLEDVFAGVTPFILLELITLILLIAFPQIALWLPSTME